MLSTNESPRPLEDIEADIRSTMDSPECTLKQPLSRTLYAACWFAEEIANLAGYLALLPDGATRDERKGALFRALYAAQDAVPVLYDNQNWEDAGYVYNDTRGENTVGALRGLADALEAVIPAAPAYSAGLLRHARNVREVLARSEIAAKAGVRRDVDKEHRWLFSIKLLLSSIAVAGLYLLWGRPLSFWVAVGFLGCVSALKTWLKFEPKEAVVARRCAEIGWPLR